MKEHRENRGPMSRLPEDQAYWEALTDHLVMNAAARLSAYRRARTCWWHGLARVSTPLFVGAAAAVLAALLWLPEVVHEPRGGASAATIYGFAPGDPLAALFVTSTEVPTMATVMATSTLERTR